MTLKEIEGNVGSVGQNSTYLAANDIADDAEVPCQIVRALRADNENIGGRTEKNKLIIELASRSGSTVKPLVVNSTNKAEIVGMYGKDVRKWKGCWIWLRIEPLPRKFLEHTHGIRVIRGRKDAPKQREPATAEPDPAPVKLTPDEAVSRFIVRINHCENDQDCLDAFAWILPDDDSNPHRLTGPMKKEVVAAFQARQELARNK